jgi:hypothetical protein
MESSVILRPAGVAVQERSAQSVKRGKNVVRCGAAVSIAGVENILGVLRGGEGSSGGVFDLACGRCRQDLLHAGGDAQVQALGGTVVSMAAKNVAAVHRQLAYQTICSCRKDS